MDFNNQFQYPVRGGMGFCESGHLKFPYAGALLLVGRPVDYTCVDCRILKLLELTADPFVLKVTMLSPTSVRQKQIYVPD